MIILEILWILLIEVYMAFIIYIFYKEIKNIFNVNGDQIRIAESLGEFEGFLIISNNN